jgi:DNA helicase-2/ATP-dependent DNA helicase PcrA
MSLGVDALNDNQRRAVEWDSGPLLVLAGPGSGKTRVLATRVVRILNDSPGERFRVLALTFTNRAAAEMRTRVIEAIPYEDQDRVLLTTFHSFCGDVLRQHGSHVGVRPDYSVISTDEGRQEVLEEVLCRLASDGVDVGQPADRVLKVLDRLFHRLLSPGHVREVFANQELGEGYAQIYGEYRAELAARNQLDFASLICLTHELLAARPGVLEQTRVVYKHLCVDEFQDTNLAQYQLLRQLAAPDPSTLFVVADDDQVLYQWNGASPHRLSELLRDFGAQTVQLPTNYRCPPEVIALANSLIENNPSRAAGKQPLVADRSATGGQVVRCRHFPSFEEELAWVAHDICRRPRDEWGRCVAWGEPTRWSNRRSRPSVRRAQCSGLRRSTSPGRTSSFRPRSGGSRRCSVWPLPRRTSDSCASSASGRADSSAPRLTPAR